MKCKKIDPFKYLNENGSNSFADRKLAFHHGSSYQRSAAMPEWLCSLACTTKVLCSNLGAPRHRMTLDKSVTAVCLGLPGRCILITCDIHRTYGELKRLSGGTLRQVGRLSRATARNSCRKNIALSKQSPESTLYRKAGYSFLFLSTFFNHSNAVLPQEKNYSKWFPRIDNRFIYFFF